MTLVLVSGLVCLLWSTWWPVKEKEFKSQNTDFYFLSHGFAALGV